MKHAIREFYFWLVANPAVMLSLAVAACTLGGFLPGADRIARALQRTAGLVSVAVFGAVVALYFTRPDLIDHVEPQIAAVGWLHHTGHPIYHALDGRQVYSGGPYGAGTILLVSACYALFGASLVAAKLASAGALGAALFAGGAALRREDARGWLRGMTELIALLALPYGAAFWLRADPALVAVAAVGTAVIWIGGRAAAVGGAALSLGAICWLKVHGALYLFPAFVVLAARFGFGAFLAAGIGGAALGAAQFLPWNGHGENFLAVLRLYAGNKLVPARILPMLQWAVIFSAPLWAVLLARGAWRAAREDWLLRGALPALAAALAGAAVLAARPGLGYWHLLPFAPAIVLFAARLRHLAPTSGKLARAVWTGWWLTAAFLVYTRHDDVILRLADGEAEAEQREIDSVRAVHPGRPVYMGLGEELNRPSYRRTFQRAYLAVRGEPYPYDLVVMMDYQYLGLPAELATSAALPPAEQRALVLVPAGEKPWAANSVFGGPALPAEFRGRFDARFRLLQRGERYDVWGDDTPVRTDQP